MMFLSNTMIPDHGGDDRENVRAATYNIKKGDRIKFRMSGEETSILGKVESRAGKANGKWKGWWNIENEETGEKASYDTNIFQELEKIEAESTDGKKVNK